jgi:hypothetical protein
MWAGSRDIKEIDDSMHGRRCRAFKALLYFAVTA